MSKVLKLNKKDKKIDNKGIYVYEKVSDNKYTVSKLLGEYEDLGSATDILMKIVGNEVSEEELTKILEEKRKMNV